MEIIQKKIKRKKIEIRKNFAENYFNKRNNNDIMKSNNKMMVNVK